MTSIEFERYVNRVKLSLEQKRTSESEADQLLREHAIEELADRGQLPHSYELFRTDQLLEMARDSISAC
jgi:hypothetical protein